MGEKKLEEIPISAETASLPSDRLWTKADGMKFLGVGKSKYQEMLAAKEIPFLKVGNEIRHVPELMWAWARKQSKA